MGLDELNVWGQKFARAYKDNEEGAGDSDEEVG